MTDTQSETPDTAGDQPVETTGGEKMTEIAAVRRIVDAARTEGVPPSFTDDTFDVVFGWLDELPAVLSKASDRSAIASSAEFVRIAATSLKRDIDAEQRARVAYDEAVHARVEATNTLNEQIQQLVKVCGGPVQP